MKKLLVVAAGLALAGMLVTGPVFAADPGAGQNRQEAGKPQQQPKKAKRLSRRNQAKIEQTREAQKRQAEIKKERSK